MAIARWGEAGRAWAAVCLWSRFFCRAAALEGLAIMWLLWIFVFLIAQRMFEIWLSHKNLKELELAGARQFYPESFRVMVCLHTGFLLSLFWESYPWQLVL